MKSYICHCNVQANDNVSHIKAKPTVYVEANDRAEAFTKAEK